MTQKAAIQLAAEPGEMAGWMDTHGHPSDQKCIHCVNKNNNNNNNNKYNNIVCYHYH